jgi:hypothetical protein
VVSCREVVRNSRGRGVQNSISEALGRSSLSRMQIPLEEQRPGRRAPTQEHHNHHRRSTNNIIDISFLSSSFRCQTCTQHLLCSGKIQTRCASLRLRHSTPIRTFQQSIDGGLDERQNTLVTTSALGGYLYGGMKHCRCLVSAERCSPACCATKLLHCFVSPLCIRVHMCGHRL